MTQSFVLPASADRSQMIERIRCFAAQLSKEKRWLVTFDPYVKKRSSSQNAYLWGVAYPVITQHLEGWTGDDVHEFFLGEHFGWQTVEGFGRKRMKPLRRSSGLSTVEFNEHVEFIQRFMAERGVYIPDPNERDDGAP